jgi:hypothetical protein
MSALAPLQNKAGRNLKTGRFLTGNDAGGRPKGSRNKLGQHFIGDLYAEWQRSGVDALKRLSAADPAAFIRTVAQILPKELEAKIDVDVGLFADIKNFTEAYRLAREYIGTEIDSGDDEGTLLIETSHDKST